MIDIGQCIVYGASGDELNGSGGLRVSNGRGGNDELKGSGGLHGDNGKYNPFFYIINKISASFY